MRIFTLTFLLLLAIVISGNAQSVKIGNQVWSSKNLDVSTFRNGDTIPEARSEWEWKSAGDGNEPAWCYYANDPANGTKYGKLYNFNAVTDRRGLAPEGWHVPSEAEWDSLINYLGGYKLAGIKMKNSSGWFDGNGTNESGFSGFPGGGRFGKGQFFDLGNSGYFWSTTTRLGEFFAKTCDLLSNNNDRSLMRNLIYFDRNVYMIYSYVGEGLSVRCIKDTTSINRVSVSQLTDPIKLNDTLMEIIISAPPPTPINNTLNETGVLPLSDSISKNVNLFSNFRWRLFLRNTTLKPQNDSYYSYLTINIGFSSQKSGKYQFRSQYENPFLGDIIAGYFRLLKTYGNAYYLSSSGLDHTLSSGILGWLQIHNNVVVKKNLIISPGVSFGDQNYFSEARDTSGSIVKYDPAGYWGICVGPSVMLTTDIIKGFRFDFFSSLDFAVAGSKSVTPGYPMPIFLKYGCSLTNKTGIFCSARMNSLIDTGKNNQRMFRIDFSLGYTFRKH